LNAATTRWLRTASRQAIHKVSGARLVRRHQPRAMKLASMDAIYEKDVMRPVYPADRLAVSAADTAPHRRSYLFLAHGARGYLPDDIPGDDRPELVAALYDAVGRWLRTED